MGATQEMTGTEVQVAVVVVTHDSSDVLPGLVESLPGGLAGLSWRLVVVDNASTDGSLELASRLWPGCTGIETGRNAGYSAGLNAGVAAAPPHEAVLVLNPDVRLSEGSVGRLLEVLRTPGIGIAVPQLRDGEGRLHFSLRRRPTTLRALADAVLGAVRAGRVPLLGELVTDPRRYDSPCTVDWAEGSTQLISAECWRAVGPWDESFFLYSEETEFGLRAGDHGYGTRYVPEAVAVHLQGDSTTSPWLWALLVTNRVRLHRRRGGRLAGATFWAAVLLRELTRAALGQATSRAAVRALTSPRLMRDRPGPHWAALWAGPVQDQPSGTSPLT
jgi:N-acetylglucosaminyl-diphospho-decaprenol L-rhamnosyltransferase